MIFLGTTKTIEDLQRLHEEALQDVKRYEEILKQKRERSARIQKLLEINIDIKNSELDFEWVSREIEWLPKKENKP